MRSRKQILIALAIISVAGIIRLPVEAKLEAEIRGLHFREGAPDLALRDQLSQMQFVAALGGFRSLVASGLDIRTYLTLADKDWGELEALSNLTTTLQPRVEKYWDMASWHMAFNATSHYQNNVPDSEIRLAIRNQLVSSYTDKGKAFLKKGLTYLPDSGELHLALANLYRSKDPNPPEAAKHFRRAFECKGNPPLERAYAHELVKCSEPERWQTAYDILKRYYDQGERSRTPSGIRDLKVLEERLNIPFPLRIREQAPTPRR